MLWWLLWSCSPQLPAPAATGSTVMFDTEAQADTLALTKVVEQADGTVFPHSLIAGVRQV